MHDMRRLTGCPRLLSTQCRSHVSTKRVDGQSSDSFLTGLDCQASQNSQEGLDGTDARVKAVLASAQSTCDVQAQMGSCRRIEPSQSEQSDEPRDACELMDSCTATLRSPGNAEIFTLTYGSLVRQLLADLETVEAVNKQLDTMGYNIGVRLIDEFLAKSKTTKCVGFRDAVDKMARVGFKLFLNITPVVTNWNAESTECSLILEDNPLADFVELPEGYGGLTYCNILCGVIRGALEQVKMSVECEFVRDVLRGDDVSEMRLKLASAGPETYPYQDDD